MSATKQQIFSRWNNCKVLFECDVPDEIASGLRMRHALEKATQSRADLRGAYLRGAYLSGADLSGADLSGADLSGADLRGADLSGAYLSGADLSGADLRGADLSGAYLSGAKDAELAIAKTRILPAGDLIGWKKCRDGVVVKLLIPATAKRSHAFGRKCRAEFADVLEIVGGDKAESMHKTGFFYEVGVRVVPDSFDENWQDECSHGLHFFIQKLEAQEYEL